MQPKDYEQEDRMGFIRKVYAILSAQLCITAGCIAYTKLNSEVNESIKEYYVLAIVSIIVGFIVEMVLLCYRNVARKVPMNYILLTLFTMCEAFAFSFICAFYTPAVTLYAASTTAALTGALTIYAFTTKTDFTMCGGLMVSICVAMFMLFIMSFFLSWVSWWTTSWQKTKRWT